MAKWKSPESEEGMANEAEDKESAYQVRIQTVSKMDNYHVLCRWPL